MCANGFIPYFPGVKKTIIIYSLAIAGAAFLLQWMEYLHVVRVFSTEIYMVLIAVFFSAIGIWAGNRLTRGSAPSRFTKNLQALKYLGISDREYDVLELLAQGQSNKEIAETLFVSGNTVKTHLAHLYEKLEVSRRTQAIQKARSLNMIP